MDKPALAILLLFLVACSPSRTTVLPDNPTPSIPLQLPAQWTKTPTPSATPVPSVTSAPTLTPTSTSTVYRLANGMAARPPSKAEPTQIKSIWSLTNYREMTEPSSMEYFAEVSQDSVWLWDWSFCAAGQQFLEYMSAIDLEFQIDGQSLREGIDLLVYDSQDLNGWLCRTWVTVLSKWPPNHTTGLMIHYTYRTVVFDGKTHYPAGGYGQLILALVKG